MSMEEVYTISTGDERTVEKILLDENLQYLHMIFGPNDGLPEHLTNSTVYMTVVRGRLTIALDGGEDRKHPVGTLLKIPEGTRMNVRNLDPETLELIVVKSPAPKK